MDGRMEGESKKGMVAGVAYDTYLVKCSFLASLLLNSTVFTVFILGSRVKRHACWYEFWSMALISELIVPWESVNYSLASISILHLPEPSDVQSLCSLAL